MKIKNGFEKIIKCQDCKGIIPRGEIYDYQVLSGIRRHIMCPNKENNKHPRLQETR